MRLWHYKLIPVLPRQQLLGQHRECCALRGNGWGRKHATVDYVFRHSPWTLWLYHKMILAEMCRRGYRYEAKWEDPFYRGLHCLPWTEIARTAVDVEGPYAEHDEAYLHECLENLRGKGIRVMPELLRQGDDID
ncbi:MAG: TIGR02328 family protein [Selenomonadaceae bacterium]